MTRKFAKLNFVDIFAKIWPSVIVDCKDNQTSLLSGDLDLVTRKGDRKIHSVSERLPDNAGVSCYL